MRDAVREYVYKTFRIQVIQDEDPINPFMDWDGNPSVAAFHRNYDLSSKDVQCGNYVSHKRKNPKYTFDEPEDLIEFIQSEEVLAAVDLYLLDHSGLWLSSGRFDCDPQGWDTSRIGYMFITKSHVKEWYGEEKEITDEFVAYLYKQLDQSVELYNDYLTGNVYGYKILNGEDGEEMDSCWGYYGDDRESGLLDQAKGVVDYEVKELYKRRKEQMKKYLIHKIPLNKRVPFDVDLMEALRGGECVQVD